MRNSKKVKGFTLVELIVVIAIIAILAAILVPNMLSYIKQSRYTQADANAKNIHTAATAAMAQAYVDGLLGEDTKVTLSISDAIKGDKSATTFVAKVDVKVGEKTEKKDIPFPGLDPKSFDGQGKFAVDPKTFAVVSAAWVKDPNSTALDKWDGSVPTKEAQEAATAIIGYYPTPVAEGKTDKTPTPTPAT